MARVSADFTKTLNLKDADGEAIQPKEIWAALEVGGGEVGERSKVSDETLVQLLLASDASISTYLTLVYEGDDNPISTIYKEIPTTTLASDGSGLSLKDYFSAVATAGTERTITPNGLTDDNNWYPAGNNIYYIHGKVGVGTDSPDRQFHLSSNDFTSFQMTGKTANMRFEETDGNPNENFDMRTDSGKWSIGTNE